MIHNDSKLPNSEAWQLAEIEAGIAELDAGNSVSHDLVAQWLESWGTSEETEPPVTALPNF